MTDRLLRKKEIADILGTSPGVAASILRNMGVQPIDFGFGRYRGPRWLESAVAAAIRTMHERAQPKPKVRRVPKSDSSVDVSLVDTSVGELFDILTNGQSVQ